MNNQSDDSIFTEWCNRERVRRALRNKPFDSKMLDKPRILSKSECREDPRGGGDVLNNARLHIEPVLKSIAS